MRDVGAIIVGVGSLVILFGGLSIDLGRRAPLGETLVACSFSLVLALLTIALQVGKRRDK